MRRHAYHGDAFPHPNDERATAQTHDLSPYRPLGTFIHGAEYHGKRKHRNTGNTPDHPGAMCTAHHQNRRTFEKQTDKPNTATELDATGRETHPTGHTEGGTNGPPEPRQTHGSTIHLSLTGHSGGLLLGTTDCKRPAAGEELPHHHCAPGHGIWLGRTSAVGVKSSCMQIWVPAGFRPLACRRCICPHSQPVRQ